MLKILHFFTYSACGSGDLSSQIDKKLLIHRIINVFPFVLTSWSSVADQEILMGAAAAKGIVSSPSYFIANARNELCAFHTGKDDLLEKKSEATAIRHRFSRGSASPRGALTSPTTLSAASPVLSPLQCRP